MPIVFDMPPTPIRNIRVPDELWERVKHKAWIDRTDVTSVIVTFLETYASSEPSEAP